MPVLVCAVSWALLNNVIVSYAVDIAQPHCLFMLFLFLVCVLKHKEQTLLLHCLLSLSTFVGP